MLRRTSALALLSFASLAGCGTADDDASPAPLSETNAPLTWVGPSAEDVQIGDVVELVVLASDPSAQTVRFEVDGQAIAVCDPRMPDEDCRRGSTWRWSTTFDRPGTHSLRATLVRDGQPDVTVEQSIDVATSLPDVTDRLGELELDDPSPEGPDPMQLGETQAASQSFDPARPFHNVFGGVSWKVNGQRVQLARSTPVGSVTAVARCMNRYGNFIRRFADSRNVSRASIVATAITESGCTNPRGSSDGLSSGPMQVTGSTCAALTGLSSSTCRARMYSNPGFSFDVGTRYMASTYQRRQHRRDPPKIAAAYNAGSIRRSYANRWHMVTTGNHIDRFVNAYNAYRAWALEVTKAAGTSSKKELDFDLVFQGEHVSRPSDLPSTAVEGQVVFVGDWAERDGAFYVREGGVWRTDVE